MTPPQSLPLAWMGRDLHAVIVEALTTSTDELPPEFVQRIAKRRDTPVYAPGEFLEVLASECCGCDQPNQPDLIADVIVHHLKRLIAAEQENP